MTFSGGPEIGETEHCGLADFEFSKHHGPWNESINICSAPSNLNSKIDFELKYLYFFTAKKPIFVDTLPCI